MSKRYFCQIKGFTTQYRRSASVTGSALLLLFLVLCIAALWGNRTAWAAPSSSAHYQTVPIPTNEPTNTPVPTATPRRNPTATPVNNNNDEDNNDDDSGSEPSPTNTPAPTPLSNTAELTGTVAAVVLNVREGPGTTFPVVGTVTQSSGVEILERNEDGSWWRICCVANSEVTGWVSAQFITPAFDAARANELIPLAGAIPTPAAAADAPVLQLEIGIEPAFVWPGREFTLTFVVTNLSDESVQNVSLGDELVETLTLISVSASESGTASSSIGASGATLVEAQWSEVAAGEAVSATVVLQVIDGLANGAVIDNLAAVGADGVDDITAGISIGMPPTTLPDFN